MNNPNLENIIEVLLQDLNYCIDLFENNLFGELNIAANRFIENCVLLNNSEYFIIGLFLKDISDDYNGLISRKDKPIALDSAKIIGTNLLQVLKESLKNHFDLKLLWKNFHIYKIGFREFQQNKFEKISYKENIGFAKVVFNKLISYLNENKDYLTVQDNRLNETILNSIIRVIRNHSCSISDTIIYMYLKSFHRLYAYLQYSTFKIKKMRIENLEKLTSSIINFIFKNKNSILNNYEALNDQLWDIILLWRENYFKYKNNPFIIPQTISIPENVIREMIEDQLIKMKNE